MGMLWYGCSIESERLEEIKALTRSSSEEDWLGICAYVGKKHKQYIAYDDDEKVGLPSSRWTLLHHAAFHGAPFSVHEYMVTNGFAVNLPDSDGRLPCDVLCDDADEHDKILGLLKPRYKVCYDGFHGFLTFGKDAVEFFRYVVVIILYSILCIGNWSYVKILHTL